MSGIGCVRGAARSLLGCYGRPIGLECSTVQRAKTFTLFWRSFGPSCLCGSLMLDRHMFSIHYIPPNAHKTVDNKIVNKTDACIIYIYMTTLKERFETKFANAGVIGDRKLAEYLPDTYAALQSFFRQELLALAEEVQNYNQSKRNENGFYQEGRDAATEVAVIRIRSKADELK